MSWWGIHPSLSAEYVRSFAIPGSCRRCIYWLRTFAMDEDVSIAWLIRDKCPRCGAVNRDVVLRIQKDLGIPTHIPGPRSSG